MAGEAFCEALLTAHAMLEHGDEETAGIARAVVYEGVLREQEYSEVMPALVRLAGEYGWALSGGFPALAAEAVHYLLRMAESGCAEGAVRVAGRGRRKRALGGGGGGSGSGGKGAAARAAAAAAAAAAEAAAAGEEVDEEELARLREAAGEAAEAAEAEAAGEAAAAAAAARAAARGARDRAFDLHRYAEAFLHPATLDAYCGLLARWRTNSPRLNHYVVAFFERMAALPNAHAGCDAGGAPLTYRTALYSAELIRVRAARRGAARVASCGVLWRVACGVSVPP